MRLYASRFHTLLVLLVTIGTHGIDGATTCKTLLDSDSTLAKSVASWTESNVSTIDFSVFKEIDTALPWLSKCAAAIDPNAVYTNIAGSAAMKTCLSTIENSENSENSDDGDLSTTEEWSSYCTTMESELKTCVDPIMTEVMDALTSTGGCCDDFLDEVKTLFGSSLDNLVKTLAELGTNIACSERTFTNLKGASTKEMCGYSIYNSFNFISTEDDAKPLKNLAQIPNDQMCKAFEGKSFTNTEGSTTTIGFGTNGYDTMGICVEPIDTITTYLKSWDIFSETLNAGGTSFTLSDLFTSGKSITGNVFLAYATTSSNLPMMSLRAMDKVIEDLGGFDENTSSTYFEDSFVDYLNSMKSDAASLSLHIPNNADCSYSNQSVTVPYAETAAAAAAAGANAASSTKFSDHVTAGVALVSTLLLSALL